MPPEMLDELLARLGSWITKQHTSFRETLEPGLKIALTLYHLASGTKYASMKFGWRVPHNTMSLVVKEVCQAIIDKYMDEAINYPTTPEGWMPPHTLGALDGKHIACWCPRQSGSLYYKGFFSIVLMGLVDAKYKIIWADLGGAGSASDAQIYNDSELKQCAEDGTLSFPDTDPLPNDNQDVSYFFIGDDDVALRPTMMKPYRQRGLNKTECIPCMTRPTPRSSSKHVWSCRS